MKYTKQDHTTFAKINALQLQGYPDAAAAILADWKRLHPVSPLYQPAPGSDSERELIAYYQRTERTGD